MLGSPAGPGGPSQRGLWPLAPAPAPSATSFSTDGLSKYGVYSLFPGGPTFGSALYSHASTIGRFASGHIQQSSGNTFHTAHKVSDSLFSATGYTFGAPTPPPGSPYSPIPVAQLELLTKGYSNNIIIQQPQDFQSSPKKVQIMEKRCDEKCCNMQKAQRNCHCPSSPVKKIQEITTTGCSRTNPIEWTGVNVKKEPGLTPCQVAEITTSVSPVVKVEVTSPTQKCGGDTISYGNSVINSNDNAGTIASMAANTSGAVQGGGTILQCADDRTTGLAAWPVGGNHNQTITTPTLWQYPAPVPVEPMVPLSVPTMPPVGFQLVRDPTTGGLLLLPTTTGIEPLQQTVVWPSYPQPSSVLLPSLSSMQPPPLQLLSSASSDYLSSSTTLHQHTQTHSTRLVAVTTDAKRKIPLPLPATTLIKIETDGTLDQAKALQAVSSIANSTGTVFTDQGVPPLVTTHVIYQHPTNLIVSQTPIPSTDSTSCRSQGTSPVTACLTPPPELIPMLEDEPANTSTVQDASNQTDTPICSEDDNTTHTISDVIGEEKIKDVIIESNKMIVHDETEVEDTHHLLPDNIEEHQTIEPEHPEEVSSTANLPEETATICKETIGETQEIQCQQPDLSGLELLSNSIVEFESCRSSSEEKIDIPSPTTSGETSITSSEESIDSNSKEVVTPIPVNVDDSLGGLDLLCALAEQRIMEENIEKPNKKEKREKCKDRHRDRERRREKRKSKKHSSEEPKRKKMKSDKKRSSEERHRDREHRKREKRHLVEKNESDKEKHRTDREECSCKYKHYKTPESEQDVKRFLESKSSQPFCCKSDWPCMNAMELDMRIKLAELQREYKEKQKELSKLKPRKHSHHSECSKKKSRKKSTNSERSSTPPPQLDKMDVPVKEIEETYELLKPPKLCVMPNLGEIYKRNFSETDSSPEKYSSQKRKVGRPKRLLSAGEILATETIVAKKPKTNFVGYLLAAKEKLQLQNKELPHSTPPRYVEETYTHKLKKIKNNNTIILDDIKSSNIRPKLKAEATVKVDNDEDNNEWDFSAEEEHDQIGEDIEEVTSSEISSDNVTAITTANIQAHDNHTEEEIEEAENKIESSKTLVEELPNPCALTETHLEVDKLRVLTAMGGLFYAGRLNAVEPPDVYSITLDGERGNRPHIMSREEILRDAIVEVSPKSTEELPVGTRLCAYWSQQYRCLYPGSAAEPGTPDPQLDGKFVSVEFDDGDSGRIALQDIRLLPPNYPIMEYDPNPLLSLCKRRRRTSTSISTEEKVIESAKPTHIDFPQTIPEHTAFDIEQHREKRRLKKKKRDKIKEKLLRTDDKRKKRKHKCGDEFCKHKKHHKKHKKHRKHHNKSDRSRTSSEDSIKQEFTCEIIHEEESKSEEEEVECNDVKPEEQVIANSEKVTEDENSQQSSADDFPNYEAPANPEDEVTMDDIIESNKNQKSKKIRDRQESCESRSKMSAFLPARQLWHWSGKGYKRTRAKGKSKKCFYKSIQRGKESITVGDAAVFLSTGRPDRPYIGRIEAMWEWGGTMVVKVKWFYHPEETVGCPSNLQYPGALFESPHVDENDVQTISHKCAVIPLKDYTKRLGNDPARYASIYDNNDIYYLAGYYDPTSLTLKMEPGIPFTKSD